MDPLDLSVYENFEELEKTISNAEIVIGIPSRNVYHTIAYVLHNAIKGLEKYARDRKKAIIICDGLSTDPTVEIVKVVKKYSSVPIAIVPNIVSKGKGGAIKTIIDSVHRYSDADKVILLDSDLRSISPEWIGILLNALDQGCNYVAPLYRRHRFDATITNFIARPMTTALYGIDIRQPIGGDFAFDKQYIDTIANSKLWLYNPWSLYFGVDIMLTHTALAHGFTVCEADLKAKIHESKDPAKHLKNMFIEVTGSLFVTACEYSDTWKKLRVSKDSISR
ncbi:MAG TPA: glycosyltransferase, partial [Ignisphaera sp.]|nr:glycosyltransferase [Ignisphaera sp.]